MTSPLDSPELLGRIERYYDAVPRSAADTEAIGAFTLFVSRGAWPYYARPTLGATGPFTAGDIEQVRRRQRELSVPEALEWVDDTTPGLLGAVRASGLSIHQYPLMVLGAPRALEPRPGLQVRLLGADDPVLPRAQAVASVGFGHPGTTVGEAGAVERDTATGDESATAFLRERLRQGLTVMAVAEDDEGPLAVGSSQPVAGVTEIVGVATLPQARRHGLGAAVTALLVEDARRRGVDLVFLSAGSDEVARVYGRVGFQRVATACVAEP